MKNSLKESILSTLPSGKDLAKKVDVKMLEKQVLSGCKNKDKENQKEDSYGKKSAF